SQRRRLDHAISCVQSQLIASPVERRASNWHSTERTCTLVLCPNDQCSPSSATCQCPTMSAVSAHQCHLLVPISATSMPHISAHLSCLSVPLISASQCHLSMPVGAAYQC
ncbi:unnamed protein product, partial [Staurois parvus]